MLAHLTWATLVYNPRNSNSDLEATDQLPFNQFEIGQQFRLHSHFLVYSLSHWNLD